MSYIITMENGESYEIDTEYAVVARDMIVFYTDDERAPDAIIQAKTVNNVQKKDELFDNGATIWRKEF